MHYSPLIADSFKLNKITKILLIDDAYDAPTFDDQNAGELLDLLESSELREHIDQEHLSDADIASAIIAINDGEFSNAILAKTYQLLYQFFVSEPDPALDPGGQFHAAKGASLDALKPLVELLEQCGDEITVKTVGNEDAYAVYRKFEPDVIFIDYFLSPTDREPVTANHEQYDRTRSIKKIREILAIKKDKYPAIVLMSSKNVAARASDYRTGLDSHVMAVRFGFLEKGWIKGAGDAIEIADNAADVLLDTSQGFDFGRTLELALKQWRNGADQALAELDRQFRDLDVKDFAYLLRFRLYDEGAPFADYLEWFFGEALRSLIDDEVNWTGHEFSKLNKRELTQAIQGASPIASTRIADLYHRTRFSMPTTGRRVRYALGDVFISPKRNRVRMIISPDCDLVPQNGKPKATQLLTIGGEIRGLSDEKAFAGELILDKGNPKAISWNLKDFRTVDFGDLEVMAISDSNYSYFGTLRPLPAQHLQKNAIAELARVGLSVPPTVSITAPVAVRIRKQTAGGVKQVTINGLTNKRCTIMMARGGKDTKHRVLFDRRFVRALLASLSALDKEDVPNDFRDHLDNFCKNRLKVEKKLLIEGLCVSEDGPYGSWVAINKPNKKNWLQFVIDVNDEGTAGKLASDPLAE